MSSSLAAPLKISARAKYMAEVIAFRFAGRFDSTRRMLPERSVTISLIVCVLCQPDAFPYSSPDGDFAAPTFRGLLHRVSPGFRDGSAGAQAVDVGRTKSQLTENLLIVLPELGSAPGRDLRDAMDLHRAADR